LAAFHPHNFKETVQLNSNDAEVQKTLTEFFSMIDGKKRQKDQDIFILKMIYFPPFIRIILAT
jgi:hypothetical protein